MESEEGDVSQAVPDNGRDRETGGGVLDTYMDIQAPKCLENENGIMKSGWEHSSILPGTEAEAGAKEKVWEPGNCYIYMSTDTYIHMYMYACMYFHSLQ